MADKDDRLERLERQLYSRSFQNPDVRERSDLEREAPAAPESWREETDVAELIRRRQEEQEKGRVFKKILIGAVAFFVLSLGVALLVFFGGGNSVSAKNIDIVVAGPSQVAGGETLTLEVSVRNGNAVPLESALLQVEYPAGTRGADDKTAELLRQRLPLGKIPAGGEVRQTIKAVLFGEKDSIKELSFSLEYRIKDSSALFYKDKKHEIAIRSSPLILTADYSKELNSGQLFSITLSLASNSSELLRGVVVEAEYPFGFSFVSADPKGAAGDRIWQIGDLPSGDRRVIRISGRLEGQNEEERTFHFTAGIGSKEDSTKIGPVIVSSLETVRIKRPFIDLSVTLSGDSSVEYVAFGNERIKANIVWTNNLAAQLLDGRVEARLSGAFDRNSVSLSGNGFYRSVDNTVVWDKTSLAEIAAIDPGEKGVVGFTFTPQISFGGGKNPQITLTVTMLGSQVQVNQTPQLVESTVSRVIKIASNAALTVRAVRSLGPFENSGPVPPRADQKTTYTIIWTVSNSLNDIANVKVKAALPPYISWESLTSPSSENIIYDPLSREVLWNVGDVPAGTTLGTKQREVAFQITLEPSLSQVGMTPNLVGESMLSADDRFTGRTVSITRLPLSTRISSDPAFRDGDDVVVR
ncbi:hypothetical protein EPN83_03030 [Patescibacteria group bacterium]|nr:MAG: hypothetical protein EPN83_03030 [Patescibacteria group bacterium]